MSQPVPEGNAASSSASQGPGQTQGGVTSESGGGPSNTALTVAKAIPRRGHRTRSSTIVHTGPVRSSGDFGPPGLDIAVGSHHPMSHADRRQRKHTISHAFSHVPSNMSGIHSQLQLSLSSSNTPAQNSDAEKSPKKGHSRTNSAPSPPMPDMVTFTSSPAVPQVKSPLAETSALPLFSSDSNAVQLSLYTYSPTQASLNTPITTPPSLLPSPAGNLSFSRILVSYASLPWPVKAGDYLEIRRPPPAAFVPPRTGLAPINDRSDADALEGIKPNRGRDHYIFRLGEDHPSVPMNQIQVPNTVAQAFKLQHRQDVQVSRVLDPDTCNVDFIELHFSQYVGRADMWRLGMSLENTTVHVGEKITLAGGAVRADVQAIWRGRNRYASGIITPKTKTIFRSKSAQTYIFIQLCKETWEFDEDGERYYEKVLHGFLPDLFTRWSRINASHLVSIIFFGRVYYDDAEVEYMEKHHLTAGLMRDYRGQYCKDFFRVAVDFERRADWMPLLADIKKQFERSEREILLDFHLAQLRLNIGTAQLEDVRILGRWSFAYEGNVLEAINLALNPFDDHYIDRDLSRTGLSLTVVTPGTGHFAVNKNLLRLTTERMIDHGVSLDLVCLTKMPLHSVPLFSYFSERPKRVADESADRVKTRQSTPDPLYFDAHMRTADDKEIIECYSLAFWVYCSFYSKTHDKPFREDRFIPRCKMYQIQMLGILDHNLTTVSVPFLEVDDLDESFKTDDRKAVRDDYDASLFDGVKRLPVAPTPVPNSPLSTTKSTGIAGSLGTSYQSTRLLAARLKEEERQRPKNPSSPRPVASRTSFRSEENIAEEESTSNPTLPEAGQLLESHSGGMPDIPVARPVTASRAAPIPRIEPPRTPRDDTPQLRIASMTSLATSPTRSIASTDHIASGASTPRISSAKRLKNQSSKGSFASRFASSWLFGSIGARAQPSIATAAVETVGRQEVAGKRLSDSVKDSPSGSKASHSASDSITSTASTPVSIPQRIPAIRSSPAPKAAKRQPHGEGTLNVGAQPMPIMSRGSSRMGNNEEQSQSIARSLPRSAPRSFHNSYRLSKSMEDSWRNKTNAAFGRTTQHTTVNPCNPKETVQDQLAEGGHQRRWQHVRPRLKEGKEHVVKWRSLCAPACLPLTTDFMPTPEEMATFYEAHSYDIACFPDQVSFLIRPDAAQLNLPLAVMREMASQRLSQNFQFIVLPHNTIKSGNERNTTPAMNNLLPGESTNAGLRVGGASEVLKDASGAIYLSWSNHVHRLTFDPQKQSVTVQRFVRKVKHSTAPHAYKCLVWPFQHHKFQETSTLFKYPNIDAKLNFNFLDRLIAGEEEQLQSNLRFWRARFLLIPSGKELSTAAISSLMPKRGPGEEYLQAEVLITGAMKVLETLGKNQWKKPGERAKTLRLLATTFDPSTCVLDEGLMTELERLTSGKEKPERGHTLEGMTLQAVADMMNKPNNGLIIRDRLWGRQTTGDEPAKFIVHEDSFTGEQFVEWLIMTFSDVETREQGQDWGQSLMEKGLIEHVTGKHQFHDAVLFYRLGERYDEVRARTVTKKIGWFSKPAAPKAVLEHNTQRSPPGKAVPLKLAPKTPKKRKIHMSQSIILDLDPQRKSDRAEVAILHSDIVHNTKNAFHFELNWLGVTAGLLDELRGKCSVLAERYGLRFVEAPVEQIKDVGLKCAYRAPISIRLAIAPPVIPDLHVRLAESAGSAQCIHYFEYAILQKFGFVLDTEASDRYPETIEVEYTYRQKAKFDYSQFIHRSGLALVQVVGRQAGFLWCDNRPFISAPTRGRQTSMEASSGNLSPMSQRLEQARQLREELEAFCSDAGALMRFYEEVTPKPAYLSMSMSPEDATGWAGGEIGYY